MAARTRRLAAALSLAVLLQPVGPAAQASQDAKTFVVVTSWAASMRLPQSLLSGGWESGGACTNVLTLRGPAPAPLSTRVTAEWTSPTFDYRPGRDPVDVREEYTASGHADLGADVLRQHVEYRVTGGPWRQLGTFSDEIIVSRDPTLSADIMIDRTFRLGLKRTTRVQFRWTLTADLTDLLDLEASFRLARSVAGGAC